jgi:hypothetical protein
MNHELKYVSFGRDESVPTQPQTPSLETEATTEVSEETMPTTAPDGTDEAPATPVDTPTEEVPVPTEVSDAPPAATE